MKSVVETIEAGERTQWEWRSYSPDSSMLITNQPVVPGSMVRRGLIGVSVTAPVMVNDDQSNADALSSDARLIAAAPDLLEIAKAMLVVGDHIDISQGIKIRSVFAANFKALDVAIAKAEGK